MESSGRTEVPGFVPLGGDSSRKEDASPLEGGTGCFEERQAACWRGLSSDAGAATSSHRTAPASLAPLRKGAVPVPETSGEGRAAGQGRSPPPPLAFHRHRHRPLSIGTAVGLSAQSTPSVTAGCARPLRRPHRGSAMGGPQPFRQGAGGHGARPAPQSSHPACRAPLPGSCWARLGSVCLNARGTPSGSPVSPARTGLGSGGQGLHTRVQSGLWQVPREGQGTV